MSQTALTLYGTALSGHTHRVLLFLELLGLPYRFVEAPAEVRRTPEFRKLNPLGQIPVLLDGELVLADSGSILVYLAKRYAPDSQWLPQDAVGAARVQRWLSIAAGELKWGPAAARVQLLFKRQGVLETAHKIGRELFAFMDAHLAGQQWLAAEHPTIADLAFHGYVAHAPEGGLPLEPYPHLCAWVQRVEGLPRFKDMPRSPIPEPEAAR